MQSGRLDSHFPKVCGHQGKVLDIKWNPFFENIIASCSEDTSVRSMSACLSVSVSFTLGFSVETGCCETPLAIRSLAASRQERRPQIPAAVYPNLGF